MLIRHTRKVSDSLTARARRVLEGNDAGGYTKPSSSQYPFQWNWDSAVISLGLSHFDLPRAKLELRTLVSGQWRNGMLPHILFHVDDENYFPRAEFWGTAGLKHGGAVPSSGVTQPPLLATAVRRLVVRDPSPKQGKEFAQEMVPPLLAWHRWLHRKRGDQHGIPCLIHPWESGTDNSPRWQPVFDHIKTSDMPAYQRRDTVHVAQHERPVPHDYELFVHLIDAGRRTKWSDRFLLAASPFLVQDVMFTSILQRADTDLVWLLEQLGEDPSEVIGWQRQVREAFDARFWHDGAGRYQDLDLRRGGPITVNTCATFMPLYGGLASPEQARRLVEDHLNNPAEYAPGESLQHAVPTTAADDPAFEARRYWSGPVWLITNWLIWQGLLDYGYQAEAARLRQDSLSLLQHGFAEYFDPRNGHPAGTTDFSWTAALALEMAADTYTESHAP